MELDFAKYIDHTALKPETTSDHIEQLIQEAKQYGFASVCVNPYWVTKCFEQLQHSPVKVCTVIGFPLGATSTEVKILETKQAIQDGADEVDMVLNIGELKALHDNAVKSDIAGVVEVTGNKVLVKVILETALLTDEEKIRACQLAKAAGADFVKTSTGFSSGGATVSDIKLMRDAVGSGMGIKASGGIRDRETTKDMIEAGATRIGASSGVSIVNNGSGKTDY